jgi:hypothetical protein
MYHFQNFDNLIGSDIVSPESLAIVMYSLKIDEVDLSYQLDDITTRFYIPNGCYLHSNNYVIDTGYKVQVMYIPKIKISSLFFPNAESKTERFGAEVFKYEGSFILRKKHFPPNWKTFQNNQNTFLIESDIYKKLDSIKNLLSPSQKTSDAFDLKVPLYFMESFIGLFMKIDETSLKETNAPALPNNLTSAFQNDPIYTYLPIFMYTSTDLPRPPSYKLYREPEIIDILHSGTSVSASRISHNIVSEDEQIVFEVDLKEAVHIIITPHSIKAVIATFGALEMEEKSWEKVLDAFQIWSSNEHQHIIKAQVPCTIKLLPSSLHARILESDSSRSSFVCVSDFVINSVEASVKILNGIPENLNLMLHSIEACYCVKRQLFSGYGVPIVSEFISTSNSVVCHFALEDFSVFFELQGDLKNTLSLSLIDIKVVDYGIELVISTVRIWVQAVRNILKTRKLTTSRYRIETFLCAINAAIEQGDLKTVKCEKFGQTESDSSSAFITFLRIAFDNLINANKWAFLIDERETPPNVCDIVENISKNVKQLWGSSLLPYLPYWLQFKSIYNGLWNYQKLNFSILMSFTKFRVSIYDKNNTSGYFGFASLNILVRINNIMTSDNLNDCLDIIVYSLCPSTEMRISPSLLSFFLDWNLRMKSRSPISKDMSLEISLPETQSFLAHNSILLYFDLGSLKVSIEERNAGVDFLIESFSCNVLVNPTYNEWLHRLGANRSVCTVMWFKKMEFQLFDASSRSTNTHLLAINCNSARTLLDYSIDYGKLLTTLVFDEVTIALPRSLLTIQLFFEKARGDFEKYMTAFSYPINHEVTTNLNMGYCFSIVVKKLSFNSELLQHFRFSYVMKDYLLTINQSAPSITEYCTYFQYQLLNQELIFNIQAVDEIRYPLPRSYSLGSIRFIKQDTGDYDSFLDGDIVIQDWSTTINIEILDRIFTTYSVISGELSDLLRLISHYTEQRNNEARLKLHSNSKNESKSKWELKAHIIVNDSCIIGESPKHSVVFRSDILTSSISVDPNLRWGISALGMDIKMSHREAEKSNVFASAIMDVELEQDKDETGKLLYNMTSKRLYGCLEGESIFQLLDIIDFWEKEITRRSYLRAFNLKEMRENALVLFSSLKAGDEALSSGFALQIEFGHVCMGMILSDTQSQPFWGSGSSKRSEVLLMSFKGTKMNRVNQTTHWQIRDLYFMFVNAMDTTNFQQYDPEYHKSLNFASLPKVSLIITKTITSQMDHSKIESKIDGLLVCIDESFTNRINKVFDITAVYRKYRENTTVLTEDSKLTSFGRTIGKIESAFTSQSTFFSGSTLLQIEAVIHFAGLTLKVYSPDVLNYKSSDNVDTICLPGVVLKFDVRTIVGRQESRRLKSNQGIYLDFEIEPSENLLQTKFIEFLRAISQKFQNDYLKANDFPVPPTPKSAESTVLEKFEAGYTGHVNYQELPVTFVFRLGSTSVNLSCIPYSNVECSIKHNFAFIVLSYVPKSQLKDGHQSLNCTASIQKIKMNVRHEFSPEDCIKSDIETINLNGNFC